MDINTKISEIESEIGFLKYEIKVMKSIISPHTPHWAKNSIAKAELMGLKPSPYGESLDLCRALVLLDMLGLLAKD